MASFQFEFVSPDKLQFRGQVESVLVPGSEGDFVVLKDHAPVMASLRPGVVAIGEAAGKETRFFVRGGFADASRSVDPARGNRDPADDLNAEQLDQEIKNAEEDVADATEDGKRIAQDKLDRLRELKDSMKL